MRWCARVLGVCFVVAGLSSATIAGQSALQTEPTAPSQPEPPRDALGRSTPRGTVLGFLNAARKGEYQLARQYLDTPLSVPAAEQLANQLFAVLDARLPARLPQISDVPEGSRSNPLAANEEQIATIGDANPVDIVLQRVERTDGGPIWLFSAPTLGRIPGLYNEVVASRAGGALPGFLTDTRLAGVPLFEWVALLTGLPLLYFLFSLLNRLLTPAAKAFSRRAFARSGFLASNALPAPARVLLFSVTARWLSSVLPLSLLPRQILSNLTALLTIAAVAWLLMQLLGEIETIVVRRLATSNTATISLLRVGRRCVDVLIVFVAILAILRHFGIDPTPALAGLGVGGIAVALAAQKTLENVIAGASLIFDQAVRVGDSLKMGEIVGTVDHIGLRSTRIRTPDRTVITIPNSQIASASLETLSARDKFWFHPVLGLRYETTPDQLRAILDNIRRLLITHDSVSHDTVRVRFIRLGAFSLDIDVFAYVFATDWNQFLEIQEELLFSVADIVSRAGAGFAFPSQTMYVENATAPFSSPATVPVPGRAVVGS
jgi:MscS family membrane protein